MGFFYLYCIFAFDFDFFCKKGQKQVKEAEFTNPFESFKKPIEKTMQLYPNEHKHCVVPCKCKKEIIDIKYPNIVDKKDDDFCQQHQLKFNNECHKLPSGRIMWIGCPKCKLIKDNKLRVVETQQMLKDSGLRLREGKWERPVETNMRAANEDYKDFKTRSTGDE